jgi:serine protease Do
VLVLIVVLTLSAQGFGATLAGYQESGDTIGAQLRRIEERYRGSLVLVRYRQQVRRSTAEPAEEAELETTGVVVSSDGLVMVSAIVFEPFNQVPHGVGIRFPASVSRVEARITEARVRFVDGNEFAASLAGRDPDADVAFFRIDLEEGESELSPVAFVADVEAHVGDRVVVASLLPDPLGPALSVELSRVQAVTKRPRPSFVVTTGASDPVGSLVVSLDGRVVGFLDAITVSAPDTRSRNPLAFLSILRNLSRGVSRGYARPGREFVDVGIRIAESEQPRRGWLGVEMQAVSKELASHLELPVDRGILLGYVYRDSPAERAGLAVGDVLIELGGETIDVNRDDELGRFADRIVRAGPGAQLPVTYIRDGQTVGSTVSLEPAPRSAREAETVEVDELDLVVREITYDFRATQFIEPDRKGVVVVEPPIGVTSNQNRIAPGDLLVRVDSSPVADLDGFRDVMARLRAERPDEVVLFVERGRESFFFAVKPNWD